MDFTSRAHLSEWMDEPCSYADFRECLHDLAKVNRLTFAYRPTLLWLQSVLPTASNPVHIVDVGCGGGDMLRQIERWARSRNIAVRLTGIDLNPYAARAAREMTSASSAIEWRTGDAFSYQPDEPIDYVVSSLFTHHLPDDEIVRFLAWMERVTTRGWFVNDLHRERLPYFGFELLAKAMRWHRFVQHDGPISIRRAFRHKDWETYLTLAGLPADAVELLTFRPARLCVARVKP
jgi:SAM-dependent methyltransferase